MERALGWRPTRFRRAAESRGASETAARWIVADDAHSAFVKIGATERTAGWTRMEHRNYAAISGWFLPRVLGFDDDGARPALALEDLSREVWPPPWTNERIGAVLEALAAIARTPPPAHLLGLEIQWDASWRGVERNPGAFLALGLCSPAWLERNLPALIAAADHAPLSGTSMIHLDVRSDNLCFRDGRAVLIDWNHAGVGNADLDVAFWLPSLQAEGGPPPEEILQQAPGLAAFVAGFFCNHAGEDPLTEAPHVRPLQLAQARTALPWAARALGLEDPRPIRRSS
jgi:Phosphotransferase enzyme family